MQVSRIPSPGPPNSLGTPKFIRPAAKAFSQISRGKISLSSYSRARGIISCSLNLRASALSSCCSSLRSKPIIKDAPSGWTLPGKLPTLNAAVNRNPLGQLEVPWRLEKGAAGDYDGLQAAASHRLARQAAPAVGQAAKGDSHGSSSHR